MAGLGKRKLYKPDANWLPPLKTIFLVGAGRSGSSYFGDLMTQTKRLGNPLEYFSSNLPDLDLLRNDRREPETLAMCRAAAKFSVTDNGVGSIKLFDWQFDRLARHIDLEDWFPNRYWVWLRRRDILRQAISWSLAGQSGAWNSQMNAQRHSEYRASDITRRLKQAAESEARWRVFFARTGIQPLELWYEDIVEAPTDSIQSVAVHADIDLGDAQVTESSKLSRQSNDVTRSWRDRYFADAGTESRIDRLDAKPKRVNPRSNYHPIRIVKRVLSHNRGLDTTSQRHS